MTLRILLADSSIAAQSQGAKILAAAGHDIVTVSNGVAAFRHITEAQFDVCLLDVYLPGAGGVEICANIKTRSAMESILVLLTAGRMDPFSTEEAIKVRAEGFIRKPFEASRLIPVLEKLVSRVRPQDTATALSSVPKRRPSETGYGTERRILEPKSHLPCAGGTAGSRHQSGSKVPARTVMTAVPGRDAGEICDVCGCVNDRGAFECQRCDIPLPSSVTPLGQRVR